MARSRRWPILSVFLISCASLSVCGCFALYPETYDASGFEEFQYQVEFDPPCQEPSATSTVRTCEAAITRQTSGEYLVLLVFTVHDQSDSPDTVQRTMTESEVQRMLELFGRLRINRNPQPFCKIIVPGTGGDNSDVELLYRWDDLELVLYDCDRPRLDWRLSPSILLFLGGLVTDSFDETAKTTDE